MLEFVLLLYTSSMCLYNNALIYYEKTYGKFWNDLMWIEYSKTFIKHCNQCLYCLIILLNGL
jgi:hypothetical protein